MASSRVLIEMEGFTYEMHRSGFAGLECCENCDLLHVCSKMQKSGEGRICLENGFPLNALFKKI